MKPRELTRAENYQRSRQGMREDKGVGDDRYHRYSHGCTSRSLEYHPIRPPMDITAKLPQLYRSILTDHLCRQIEAVKFTPGWNHIHGRDYSWSDFFVIFPSRPEECNQLIFEKWKAENPKEAAIMDAEWDEFLKGIK